MAYLASVFDSNSNRIVAYNLEDKMTAQLATKPVIKGAGTNEVPYNCWTKNPIIMRCFFMTKYSNELKMKIVKEYYSGKYSFNDLAVKYNIGTSTTIQKWFYLAESQGLRALKIRRTKHKYNAEFKLHVIKYYQNHEMGTSKVAAIFNIEATLVERWNNTYNTFGINGLVSKQKGRLYKYMKDYKKINNNNDNKDQKIKELEHRLHKAELERDCLKALQDMRLSQIEKNQD